MKIRNEDFAGCAPAHDRLNEDLVGVNDAMARSSLQVTRIR
jgi:hypothetical protein